ncbi:MAG: hypothetical protein OXE94_01820 [Aestuariivita sp.]|nr:hypothetical protein [Aestuariivita sp.]MCY4202805.1 hypothetical protein [Aestuariivita sp.]
MVTTPSTRLLPDGAIKIREKIAASDVAITGIAVILIVSGLVFLRVRFYREARVLSNKRNIVIEARGLRDDDGDPLIDTIKKHHAGAVTPILLDLRNRLDGEVVEPETTLDDIEAMHRSVLRHKKNGDRSDLTTFYGGLTSVP